MTRRQARFAITLAGAHRDVVRILRRIDLGAEHHDLHLREPRQQLLVAWCGLAVARPCHSQCSRQARDARGWYDAS
jgi:hypothetical protein